MQGGRDPFDHFAGFGHQRSLVPEFFGGRDPFDDPFFRSPFGGMFDSNFFGSMGGPFANLHNGGPFANFHNRGPFANLHNGGSFANLHNGGSFANLHNGGPFMNSFTGGPSMNPHASGFLEHQPHQPNPSRGLVIEELNSDDEKEEDESGKMKKENPRKHGRSCEVPIVEDSDDEATERKSKLMARRNDVNQMQHVRMQPGMNSFTFQSSTVSYGGANGAFYTTSATRRSGSDGLSYEEFREADSSSRQATHRVSKGIHDKGHSVTRKLKSNGHVDTMQTLHNLNQDELAGFEQSWNGNAKKHLPGWREQSSSRDVMGSGRIGDFGRQALPCIENANNGGNWIEHSGRAKPDVGNRTVGSSRGGSNRGSSSHQGSRHY